MKLKEKVTQTSTGSDDLLAVDSGGKPLVAT